MPEVGMTLQRRFVCVTMLCFAVALSAQTQQWKSYSYPSDGFSASFPGVPTQGARKVPTKTGSYESRSYIVAVSPTTAVYVAVNDYGANVASADPDAVLERAKQSAMPNFNSHLLREKKITFDGYHGIEFECENDRTNFVFRVYIVGSTLYQTFVMSPLGSKYADTARFLDSFKLIKRVRN